MVTYGTNQFKSGLKILINGEPYSIIENEFVKPGKGNAFNRTKIKNLKNNRVIEKTYRSGETVEAADINDQDMQYLYSDEDQLHFMEPSSFEQLSVDKSVVGDVIKWLKEEDICNIIIWNGEIISVTPPNFVVLKVIETDPGLKGDTASGGSKLATLETNAVVKVPLFIQNNEKIKIDTRTQSYVSRDK